MWSLFIQLVSIDFCSNDLDRPDSCLTATGRTGTPYDMCKYDRLVYGSLVNKRVICHYMLLLPASDLDWREGGRLTADWPPAGRPASQFKAFGRPASNQQQVSGPATISSQTMAGLDWASLTAVVPGHAWKSNNQALQVPFAGRHAKRPVTKLQSTWPY